MRGRAGALSLGMPDIRVPKGQAELLPDPARPPASSESLAAALAQLGAPLADDETTRAWLDALPGPAERPGLLAAARGHGRRVAGDGAGGPARARPFLRRRALAPARLRPRLGLAQDAAAKPRDEGQGDCYDLRPRQLARPPTPQRNTWLTDRQAGFAQQRPPWP